MSKTHQYKNFGDQRSAGQTTFEYTHTTACGYVRDKVTKEPKDVTCFYCIKQRSKPASAKIPVVIDPKTGAYLRKKGEKP